MPKHRIQTPDRKEILSNEVSELRRKGQFTVWAVAIAGIVLAVGGIATLSGYVETPVEAQEAVAEQPAEQPAAEEPAAEPPVAEEPVAEEPAVEPPVAEEPAEQPAEQPQEPAAE